MSSNSTKSGVPLEWNVRQTNTLIIACIVFLLLSYHSVLKRICRANSSGNQASRRRLLEESIQDDPSLPSQSHGLEISVIRSLPKSMFKKSEGEEKPNSVDCATCLGEFEEGEWLKNLPNWHHVFHVPCILFWLRSSSNCTLCRPHVLHNPLPEALTALPMR